MNRTVGQRLRLRYCKDEVVKYISHLELLRFALKLFRRCELPLALTSGFSPRPRVTFGPPLPLGVSADNELLDMELAEVVFFGEPELAAALQALRAAGQPRRFAVGLTGLAPQAPAISKLIAGARYRVEFSELSAAAAGQLLDAGLAQADSREHPCRGLQSSCSDGAGMIIEGRAGGEHILSILRCAAYIAETGGGRLLRAHRLCLLDAEGREL